MPSADNNQAVYVYMCVCVCMRIRDSGLFLQVDMQVD